MIQIFVIPKKQKISPDFQCDFGGVDDDILTEHDDEVDGEG